MEEAEEHARQLREKDILKFDGCCPIFFARSKMEARTAACNEIQLSKEAVADTIRDKRVLIIEEGQTVTRGGLDTGAGYALAKQIGVKEIVDPKPFAKGPYLKNLFEECPRLQVLPAMGYDKEQIQSLEDTINAVDCDVVVVGTPVDLSQIMTVDKPCVVSHYSMEIVSNQEGFYQFLDSFFEKYRMNHPAHSEILAFHCIHSR
jgi:predicted GTPase